jgi:hypothetical protein
MDRGVRALLIHAEGDEGLDLVQMVLGHEAKRWSISKAFRLEIIYGANHTFALLWSQEKLLQLVCDWAEELEKMTGVSSRALVSQSNA